jgi:predicted transcriptional regulator of viral defense system
VLQKKRKERFDVKEMDHYGVNINVTTLERTLVDLLHRPDFGGGWEEIWRSLAMVTYFNLEKVVEYALLLENATTIAKVGYFLKENSERLMVEAKHLAPLQKRRPKQPHYMDKRNRRHSRLIPEWNLIVPEYVSERMWEEPG